MSLPSKNPNGYNSSNLINNFVNFYNELFHPFPTNVYTNSMIQLLNNYLPISENDKSFCFSTSEVENMHKNSMNSLKILLVHGLLDENVHYHHSARLLDRFISSNFHQYQHIILPNDRHSFTSRNIYQYYFKLLSNFFKSHLLMPSYYYSSDVNNIPTSTSNSNVFTKHITDFSSPIKSDHISF